MSKLQFLKSFAQLCKDGLDGLVFWLKFRAVRPQDRRFFALHYGQFCVVTFRFLSFLIPGKLSSIFIAWQLKRTQLFDSAYYLRINSDVAKARLDPVLHYVRFGDAEGRRPNPLFDPSFYRSRTDECGQGFNSLLHYCWVGQHQKLSPSTWFDTQYYLQNNRDVERRGFDPLLHFLRWGGVEGRSPNPSFDSNFYLQNYADVKWACINPLLHYIETGRFQGRFIRQLKCDTKIDEDQSVTFQPGAWEELEKRVSNHSHSPQVTVIVPVYRNRLLTWGCLASALTAKNQTSFRILVIDDASPDPELAAELDEMARRGWIELLRNAQNLGFVASVNRGINASNGQDVILLNSDTEVYPGWLDRMHHAAWRHQRTASVTPLSNNATIASYPRFLHDNPYPLEIKYSMLDRLASQINADIEIVAPTGVGFCMYLRRDAIAQVGLFDEEAFGKGYGEENDWCQRAISKGWRNIIAVDTFVRHFGSASFQGEKGQRIADAMKVLAVKHPEYREQIRSFINDDPLSDSRKRLDWARLKFQARAENVLIVCHGRGGGAERHVQEDSQRLLNAGKGVFFMRPVRGQPSHVRLSHPNCRQLLQAPSYALKNIDSMVSALKELKITSIHLHGLVDMIPEAAECLSIVAQKLEIPFDVDIHDYKVICPRINLVDLKGVYCREPAPEFCNTCLTTLGNDFGVAAIEPWREMHHRVLRAARRVEVPNRDVSDRLARYYPDVLFHVEPHDRLLPDNKIVIPKLKNNEPLRVVVIGALSRIKGFDVVRACAMDAKKRKLPIKFILMGHSINDQLLIKLGVEISGKYSDEDALDILAQQQPHVVFLASTWPETYSYTLTLALQANKPVFAFDIGAISERLKELQRADYLQPLNRIHRPQQLNNQFLAYRKNCLSGQQTSAKSPLN